MSFLNHALELADKGFHVFPLIANSKLPLVKEFAKVATRDPEIIRSWWLDPVLGTERSHNIGISTSSFFENEALLVVDVDNKGEKKGDDSLFKLDAEGKELPPTWMQTTPTGGSHLIYRVSEAVKQGANVLAPGLDIRSRGGYIVGAGSMLDGKAYGSIEAKIVAAPAWLIEACGVAREKAKPRKRKITVDESAAIDRATEYLARAKLSIEGEGGDQTAFAVACQLKDLGVAKETALELLLEHWNPRCSPPWDSAALEQKVANAYRYGKEEPGSLSPEADFQEEGIEVPPGQVHPFIKLNEEFAFITAGGGHHILWETRDALGRFTLEHLNEMTFHRMKASETIVTGDGKVRQLTDLWMKSRQRRSYKGLCFRPGAETPEGWYNLWRGFAVEPLSPDEKPSAEAKRSLDMFLDHALTNVCDGDKGHFHWLIGYFAHMIQRPFEKPLVALVFRGKKGVGKNALIDRVGYLLGNHYLLSANRRYLIGNFNGHLENLLMLAFDEAFWSGDKQAEGTLKDLITGRTHVIEHKGKEPYSVENCTRVVIIGNEEWLVPATQDERRFAVFQVGEGKMQNRNFFHTMRVGMENGGYRLLLRYLLDFDLSTVDVNAAPNTAALLDQKVKSLPPLQRFWLDCITEGRIVRSDFEESWGEFIDKEGFRAAYQRYLKDRNISAKYIPDPAQLGKQLKNLCPSVVSVKRRNGEQTVHSYKLPDIEVARAEWAAFIGHQINWE